ncbi:helix-turn-helix domain-containing protein [Uruburuella testudinis]|uniref:Helix-turn-helix domain-containing protein n=2 Tax=Uruburuella testudinis TaxID=1282863 RepID=A0ABY4DU94_9NEIS|nr:helix-turn-helix domain-containing protein [Uruburuella testudinis]
MKLTQEQLAFEADIQRVYVSTLELGQQQPSLVTIFKLAKGLNCTAVELIEDTEQELRLLSRKIPVYRQTP